MTEMPRTPFLITVIGLLPLLWSAATALSPDLAAWSLRTFGARFTGPYVGLFYGAVLLGFLSGIFCGFATRLDGPMARRGYALACLPVLWVFFTHGGGAWRAGIMLIFGHAGALALDWLFWRHGAAPLWWMQVRLRITTLVLLCLMIGVTA